MKTRISSNGQLILPPELLKKDGVKPGQQFNVERIDRGEYRLVSQESSANDGVIDWLLACPAKEYFVPIGSESTDSL
jgi:bifunctional DNA-binding transcriptional regulator/antitoxin component of YhaV-PrlF toxin-antitoxin module